MKTSWSWKSRRGEKEIDGKEEGRKKERKDPGKGKRGDRKNKKGNQIKQRGGGYSKR